MNEKKHINPEEYLKVKIIQKKWKNAQNLHVLSKNQIGMSLLHCAFFLYHRTIIDGSLKIHHF